MCTRTAQVLIGILLWSAGLADDPEQPDTDAAQPDPAAVEKLLAEPGYAPRWRLLPTPTAPAGALVEERSLDEVEFRDSGSLERVTKARSLSLLTLSRSRDATLFFGVNQEGYLGLHYQADSESGDESYLELRELTGSDDADEADVADSGFDPQ